MFTHVNNMYTHVNNMYTHVNNMYTLTDREGRKLQHRLKLSVQDVVKPSGRLA